MEEQRERKDEQKNKKAFCTVRLEMPLKEKKGFVVYLALHLFSNNKSFALNVDSKSEVCFHCKVCRHFYNREEYRPWKIVVDLCFYIIILTVLTSCPQEREKQIAQPSQ